MRVVTLLVAGWLAAIAVVAVLVLSGRDTTLERGHRSSTAIAQIMEEHSARTFQAVSLTLGAVGDAWQLSRPANNSASFQGLLQQRLQDVPYVRALFIIGPDGFLIHDTDYPRTPDISLADRDYFKIHREDPRLERSVSGPVMSRSEGAGWFISVTERLGRGEQFEGLVVAAMKPAYFELLYGKLALSEGDVIALFHRDGRLIARYPAGRDETGRSFAHLPLFSTWLSQAAHGSYRVEGHMYPGSRIVSYRSVEGLPLVVHVSRSEHALLTEWRRSAVGAGVAMGALTLLLSGVLVQQLRAAKRRQRQRAQRAQAEKLEAMGQLTGGIAHDFANLLSIISMNIDLVLRKPEDTDAVRRGAESARRAVGRGSELIRRLLAFARRQPLELRAVDLNSLVTEAHVLVAQAVASQIEIVLQLAPDLAPVMTDASQFEMALLNLVVNARDAMAGRGRIVLRTYADPHTGQPCLAVEDEGPGMSEETRRRALEPFFTTKPSGTGLGLAQVYGFMQQIGGDLEIDSAPGKGTRVHLHFARASIRAKAGALTRRAEISAPSA